MGMNSNYKKKINYNHGPVNVSYPYYSNNGGVKSLQDAITDKHSLLPEGILHIDLDKGFKDWVIKDCKLTLAGEVVPAFMMSIQKWNEFTTTWQSVDEFENIKIPFISILRKPETKSGTNPSLILNIPGHPTFTYAKIPIWDGNKKGVDVYKIPQPTPIDISYEVRIFSFRQKELNSFNLIMMKMFNAGQAYVNVKGHSVPIILEDVSDESQLDDIESKRFYVQSYNIQMQGFILDPEDFVHVPSINKVFTIIGINKNK